MDTGTEWMIDAHDCCPEALRDLDAMRRLCGQVVAELDLHVVGEPAWHQFPWPAGVTGLFLLTESHLAVHTYPELGLATFNLYCCRARPAWPWASRLGEHLRAGRVSVRSFRRGEVLEREGARP
jgi:S-adenosylmethionine decarboxylase